MRNCGNKDCTQVNPQPLSSFRKRSGKKLQLRSQCKVCLNLKAKSYYKKNNEQIKIKLNSNEDRKAKHRIYDSKDENKKRARINSLKYLYGITLEEYNIILTDQNNLCKICNRHRSEFKKSLFVDHCHITGKIRGLLCGACNMAIGLLKDNPLIAKQAMEYLNEQMPNTPSL